MTPALLRALLDKYLEENISKEEFIELWETLEDSELDQEWHDVIGKALNNEMLHQLSGPGGADKALAEIKQKLEAGKRPRLVSISSRVWKVAAAILLIAGASLFTWKMLQNEKESVIVQAALPARSAAADSQRVLLTLADGTMMDPDSMENGSTVNIGKATLTKLANGQLKYDAMRTDSSSQVSTGYNTMSTPAGKQFQLILPDGSKVWLNAQTTIIYPVAFHSKRRVVKVSGEAYFEISPDKSKPFEVHAGNTSVEVLGTSFNVNAYPNEDGVKTSLLNGSVKINNHILVPGQAYANGKIVKTDVHQDVSWKDGVFNFNNQHFAQVMRTLARWYNLQVEYPNGVPQREYGGEMGVNLSLNQMLKGLEDSGLHFKLVDHRLIVQPQ